MHPIIKILATIFLAINMLHADLVISFDNQNNNDSKKPTSHQKIVLDKIQKKSKEMEIIWMGLQNFNKKQME